MPAAPQSIIDTRRHQMFPVLESADIERVRRFGKVRFYRAGEALVQVGNVGPVSRSSCLISLSTMNQDTAGTLLPMGRDLSWASWRSLRADPLSSMRTRKTRSKP